MLYSGKYTTSIAICGYNIAKALWIIPVERNLLSGEMETTIPDVENHSLNRLADTCMPGQTFQDLAAKDAIAGFTRLI